MQALQDPKTHLIFDDRIAEFVRLVVDENLFKPNPLAVSHAGQAALGSGFVARLPTFSVAPIDELIDLRNDLKKPLSRYRRGVAKMADRLSSRAYDVELNAELDDLWRMEVRPTLDEIRDEFSQHSFVRELGRSMATDVKSLVTAATGPSVVVGVQGISHLGSLASILGALAPAGVVAAQQVAKAHYARRDHEQIQEKHDLFYLYDLNRRLEGSK